MANIDEYKSQIAQILKSTGHKEDKIFTKDLHTLCIRLVEEKTLGHRITRLWRDLRSNQPSDKRARVMLRRFAAGQNLLLGSYPNREDILISSLVEGRTADLVRQVPELLEYEQGKALRNAMIMDTIPAGSEADVAYTWEHNYSCLGDSAIKSMHTQAKASLRCTIDRAGYIDYLISKGKCEELIRALNLDK